ncbi:MAG: hypothetical protein Q9M91_03255 [Candidatus Dojkabacteria bacterium]|nr:hypothetical protein [Candidatus Dojkabacteria bacterium]
MYNPIFNYTDKLVDSLIKLESHKTTLQNLDLTYNIRSKLTAHTRVLDLFHLAHILNLDLTIKDVERLANGIKPDDIDEVRKNILVNYKNTIDFNRSSLADSYAELDLSILKHLNKLLIVQWREKLGC